MEEGANRVFSSAVEQKTWTASCSLSLPLFFLFSFQRETYLLLLKTENEVYLKSTRILGYFENVLNSQVGFLRLGHQTHRNARSVMESCCQTLSPFCCFGCGGGLSEGRSGGGRGVFWFFFLNQSYVRTI